MQQLLAGWTQGFVLLGIGLIFFVYFLPSILAFSAARRRFYAVLALNFLALPLQAFMLQRLAPQLAVIDPGRMLHAWMLLAIVNLGPGWLILLAWALAPGETDPRLVRAQNTKFYDFVAALPLILWFANGALQLRPVLSYDALMIAGGGAGLFIWVQFLSLVASAAFDMLLVWLLIVRDKPVAKSRGVLPRFFGIAGTFLGVGILQLPLAQISLGTQMLAAAVVGIGSLGSLLVLWRLGRSFSIMPEARTLVTAGPYAYARHPLYGVEIVTIIGTALQFIQPWAILVSLGVVLLLVIRSVYEERVLVAAYPQYEAYRARTKRFIPGVI